MKICRMSGIEKIGEYDEDWIFIWIWIEKDTASAILDCDSRYEAPLKYAPLCFIFNG